MCKGIMKEEESNHGIDLDYGNLAYGAKMAGLVAIETNERLDEVTNAIIEYHEEDLNGAPFERVCPPKEDLDKLYDISREFEMRCFPEGIDDFEEGFEMMSRTKLCRLGVDETLEREEGGTSLACLIDLKAD